MADIRINALATTAASTASDDFIAVDGSANGTRKLNAYNPTFGGNLTVSGAGNNSFTGPITNPGSSWSYFTTGTEHYSISAANAVYNPTSGTWSVTTSATPSWRYDLIGHASSTSNGVEWLYRAGSAAANSWTAFMRLAGSGNLLIGTTTDSANGKLQLATHTTSAGGIGFGTDTSLFRTAAGEVGLDALSGTATVFGLRVAGTRKSYLYWENGTSTLTLAAEAASSSLKFLSANALALTLDSSQNATFNGGTITLGDYAGDQDVIIAAQSTGVGYLRWRPTASGTNAYGFSIAYDNPNTKLSFLRHEFSTAGAEWLSVARSTGNATFAGSIAIGNTVNTVSPTSPNRTITMVIGGTTYYIHAKTTND